MIRKLIASVEQLKKSKDGRVLASNFGYLMLLQVASYIFPLLTIPYLARVIGVEGFGKIAFASAVITWLDTVAGWGFNYTATRDVARNKDDPKKVSEIFSNVLWARFLLATLGFLLLLACIQFIPYFNENSEILLISFLLVPGNILFPSWFFQAMEDMKFITLFNLISKVLFTALIFIFITEKSDFILQPLFNSLGLVVSGLFSMYIILVRWKVKLKKPNLKSIIEIIKESSDVFINNIMPNLYNSLAVVLVGLWGGSVANGIYDAGRKLVALGNSFMDIIIRVTFPFLSRKSDSHDIFAKVYLSLSLVGSFSIFILSPLFIKLFYNEEFAEAVVVMQLTSVSIFLVALIKTYGTNFLIIKGYDRELRNITILGSLIGFIVSIPLIYYYSYIGAALTLLTAQAILGFGTMLKARSVKK